MALRINVRCWKYWNISGGSETLVVNALTYLSTLSLKSVAVSTVSRLNLSREKNMFCIDCHAQAKRLYFVIIYCKIVSVKNLLTICNGDDVPCLLLLYCYINLYNFPFFSILTNYFQHEPSQNEFQFINHAMFQIDNKVICLSIYTSSSFFYCMMVLSSNNNRGESHEYLLLVSKKY